MLAIVLARFLPIVKMANVSAASNKNVRFPVDTMKISQIAYESYSHNKVYFIDCYDA
jgi:hypothetical protein